MNEMIVVEVEWVVVGIVAVGREDGDRLAPMTEAR
jgi:hypothetical protein